MQRTIGVKTKLHKVTILYNIYLMFAFYKTKCQQVRLE